MSTYAIGDIQGCYEPFLRLLDAIDFDADEDRLWLAGDVVNRGPKSLEVVEWIYRHRHAVDVVLGNHEIHLLARADGKRKKKRLDTIDALLERTDLVAWLRAQPLVHREGDDVLVHAGFLPSWDWPEVERRATERAPEDVRVMTCARLVDARGQPDYGHKGPPEDAPPGQVPWYAAPGRKTAGLCVYFGHWAAHGHRMGGDWVALDSGCVWGNQLTAVRLEDRAVFQVEAHP